MKKHPIKFDSEHHNGRKFHSPQCRMFVDDNDQTVKGVLTFCEYCVNEIPKMHKFLQSEIIVTEAEDFANNVVRSGIRSTGFHKVGR